jgi:hypothetical protein
MWQYFSRLSSSVMLLDAAFRVGIETEVVLFACCRLCCEVYIAAVKQLPTERMWSLYLDMLIELNEDLTHLPTFKRKLLKDALQDAHGAGCMQEKYYLLWVSGCYF